MDRPLPALLEQDPAWTWIPGLLLLAWLGYHLRNRWLGRFSDREIESRGASALLGMPLRLFFAWLLGPLLRALLWLRIPATAVTSLSLLLAIAAGVAAAADALTLAGWLYLAAGLCDFLDGRIARATGTASPSGALFDSVLDRYAESALLIGLAWRYRSGAGLLAVLLALVGSLLVPYVRARGEGLGRELPNVGLLQRPERIVLLGGCLALTGPLDALWQWSTPLWRQLSGWLAVADGAELERLASAHAPLLLVVITLAAASHGTALQRLSHLLGSLGGRPTGWRQLGARGGILRAAVASTSATVADFVVVVALVSSLGARPASATFVGCALGALVSFGLGGCWAFGATDRQSIRAMRYAAVSATSALLNAGGVALMATLITWDYRLGWWLVRMLVFLLWSYPLHREYVFAVAYPERGAASHGVGRGAAGAAGRGAAGRRHRAPANTGAHDRAPLFETQSSPPEHGSGAIRA